ncbi:MAG: response regulator [Gammaproteobacteria bacterium]
MRVLIVDDSGVTRKMVARALRQAGLELDVVHEAGDGLEGLEVLGRETVDLVISDWNMPNMDGPGFVRALRKSSQVPVVMVTTEASAAKIEETRAMGANGHIAKPLKADEVQAVISPLV